MHPEQNKDQCCSTNQEQLPPMAKTHQKFAECGIEQQVKRLHAEIMGLRQSLRWINDSQSRTNTKLYALEHHQHSEKGDCMIRIEDTNRGGSEISGSLCSSIDYLA